MKDNSNLAIIILAAGKGSRMKSTLPKVMHNIAGRPMLSWLIERCESLNPQKIIVVTAPGMDDVAQVASLHEVAIQHTQKGTGDAVKAALPILSGFDGRVLILMGDEPFVDIGVLREMMGHDGLSVMAVEPPDNAGKGRVILNDDGTLDEVVEEKDCNAEQLEITLCNAGNFCVPAGKLSDWLSRVDNDNAQGEYYLPDISKIAEEDGMQTHVFECESLCSWGINNRIELAEHEFVAQEVLRAEAMRQGVTMIDPDSVTLSWDTKFGTDVVIEPNVYIGQGVVIEDNVTIHAFSHIEGAAIEDGAEVGPFARIRPKSVIGAGASIGNFIEVNRSTVKAGAKAKHVSYLGDAVIGEKSNIGAGTVIANYDGFFKHETHIGKKVFIGSNSTIISPVEIGDDAIIAAGSTVNKNITENALAIGRSRQESHLGWATQYRNMKQEQKRLKEEE